MRCPAAAPVQVVHLAGCIGVRMKTSQKEMSLGGTVKCPFLHSRLSASFPVLKLRNLVP